MYFCFSIVKMVFIAWGPVYGNARVPRWMVVCKSGTIKVDIQFMMARSSPSEIEENQVWLCGLGDRSLGEEGSGHEEIQWWVPWHPCHDGEKEEEEVLYTLLFFTFRNLKAFYNCFSTTGTLLGVAESPKRNVTDPWSSSRLHVEEWVIKSSSPD